MRRPFARSAWVMALASLCAALPISAHAEGPHQHGVASLQVVADGNQLDITLDSPLDNLLGFERGPRTAAERAAVQAMAQRLHAAAALLQPTPAAGCQLRTVVLVSPVIAPALLAKPAAPLPATTAPVAGGHADLDARFGFVCAQPQALRSLALGGLFQAFPRLRQLDAALVTPTVQRGATLRARQAMLAW